VWADGLLVFYEIFRFLEENVSEVILPTHYHRTEQFEKDLQYYLGDDWKKCYKPRESVCKYLAHLNHIKETNSLLLIPYVYHLYLGLLSGGQILVKKRQFAQKFTRNEYNGDDAETPGNALLSFPNHSLHQLKNNLKAIIDDYAKDFDKELRRAMIVESQKVFELNNTLINSVEGIAAQNLKLLGYIIIAVLSIYIFLKMWAV
jgi:heme oxygenase